MEKGKTKQRHRPTRNRDKQPLETNKEAAQLGGGGTCGRSIERCFLLEQQDPDEVLYYVECILYKLLYNNDSQDTIVNNCHG